MGSICLRYDKVPKFLYVSFLFIISGDSVSYLPEMVVLISSEGTLTQTRLGWVGLLYLVKGP